MIIMIMIIIIIVIIVIIIIIEVKVIFAVAKKAPKNIRGLIGMKQRDPVTDFFFLGFVCNCLSCFTTAKITFTSILYPQLIIYYLYHMHVVSIIIIIIIIITIIN